MHESATDWVNENTAPYPHHAKITTVNEAIGCKLLRKKAHAQNAANPISPNPHMA